MFQNMPLSPAWISLHRGLSSKLDRSTEGFFFFFYRVCQPVFFCFCLMFYFVALLLKNSLTTVFGIFGEYGICFFFSIGFWKAIPRHGFPLFSCGFSKELECFRVSIAVGCPLLEKKLCFWGFQPLQHTFLESIIVHILKFWIHLSFVFFRIMRRAKLVQLFMSFCFGR